MKIFGHFEVENLRVVFEDCFLGLVLKVEFMDFESMLSLGLKVNSVFVYQIRTGKFIDRRKLVEGQKWLNVVLMDHHEVSIS